MLKLKYIKLFSFIFLMLVILPFYISSVKAGEVDVILENNRQVIKGFGGSSAWSGVLSDSIMDSLYEELGYSILRLRIEPNEGWNNGDYRLWETELSNAKKASDRGAIVFASPWNPPTSMTESFYHNGDTDAMRLRYDMYDEYARYLREFYAYLKNNGVELYAISVQNEPDYAYDWTWWTLQEMLNFMKNNAWLINCRVMAPESFQYLKNISDSILNDIQAFDNLDILGLHLYGTPLSQFSYPLFQEKGTDKELWMTEHYFDDDNIDTLMSMAYEIHNCMVIGNMNAYVYWWIPWGNGLCTPSGEIYKRAYILGQYAKFIRPGYYRVEATSNPADNIYISAYKGDNRVVIVAVNQGNSSVNQKFNLQNALISNVASYITDNNRNMAKEADIYASDGSFTAQLSPRSITTFVSQMEDLIGDINGDGSVNSLDYIALRNYLLGNLGDIDGDINGDGSVNSLDYLLLRRFLLD